MTPKAIFFDMDDTLLDGVTAMQSSWEAVCADEAPGLGCDPAFLREVIRRESALFWQDEATVGHWRVRLEEARIHVLGIAFTKEGFDVSRVEPIGRRYTVEHRERVQLFDDSIATLEALRAAGYKIGLLTNGPAEMQREKIARFDLARHMDVMVIEGEFGRGKPDPAVFLHALEAVGVAPADAWHIGDNLFADVGGAQGVGVHGVWIHRDRLKLGDEPRAIPDRVIAHLDELRAALDL